MANNSALNLPFAHITIALLVLLASVPKTTQHSTNNGNPFGFMKNLQGCMKGQKVDGLHMLKKYLAKFGYLENLPISQNEVDTTIENNDTAEFFDESLANAIKTYQNNYRLNVTGHLDAATIEQMMKPRCGVPDIVNGKNTMQIEHKSIKNKNRKSMFGASLYTEIGSTWPSSQYKLTYQILSSNPVPGIENMGSIVQDALSKWAQYSPFNFEEVSEGGESNLVFGFFQGDHGDGYPFDGPGGVLGHTFSPTDGRSHYDGSENWSENPDSTQMDINSVVLHEIGHILGLGHSQDLSAVMYPSIAQGVKKRDLQEDDIQGIQALYNSN